MTALSIHERVLLDILHDAPRGTLPARELHETYRERAESAYQGVTATPVSKRWVRECLRRLNEKGYIEIDGAPHERTYHVDHPHPLGRLRECPVCGRVGLEERIRVHNCPTAIQS